MPALTFAPMIGLPVAASVTVPATSPCGPAGAKARTPLGVPNPVGPSYPVPAVHRYVPPQDPLEPLVTSFSAPVVPYGYSLGYVFAAGVPARAYVLAMIGAPTLVPPKTCQPGAENVSYTAAPVCGSATADTSATVRLAQPASVCTVGLPSNAEQPLPAPLHAVSDQPRVFCACSSEVPPTDVTNLDAAGYSTPKPASPELTVMATPGWLKSASAATSVGSSGPP